MQSGTGPSGDPDSSVVLGKSSTESWGGWGEVGAGTVLEPASPGRQACDFGGSDLIPNLAEPEGYHCVESAAHRRTT